MECANEQFRTVATVASWFALNIMIGNLNGWVLRRHGFAYPVLLTTIHMVCCWVLSGLYNRTLGASSERTSVSAELRRKVNVLSLAFCASVAWDVSAETDALRRGLKLAGMPSALACKAAGTRAGGAVASAVAAGAPPPLLKGAGRWRGCGEANVT